ncbi:MAG: hypothetical protein ATN32_03055 [Candidatus Epulonipiscium fishelsonii]|nr:MAG: hypothetical protein ATN32_03055 [Epulopiscium sp. AS2M-Bin002]
MKKIDKIIDDVMRAIMAISMLSLVAGGFWQIFTRWVLNNPSTVTEEFMRYMLIWASMIGSAYCFYTDQHLSLDLFKNKMTGKVSVANKIFIEIAIMFFILFTFVYGGGRMAINSTNASPVLQLPFTFLYSVLPISGIFIVLARGMKYIRKFKEQGGKQ